MKYADSFLAWLGDSEKLGFNLMRIAIAIVFLWIGAIKFAPYEADSITPFVANNPVMSHFYRAPEQYKAHLTKEGELVEAQREWQQNNGTYSFSDGLGTVEILIGLLVLSGIFSAPLGALGALLAFLTSFVTLSFLITTPEAWVPALGDANHGFPYPSGAGRLVIKDVMLWAGGLLLMIDSARALRLRYSHLIVHPETGGVTFVTLSQRRSSARNTSIGVVVLLALALAANIGVLSPAASAGETMNTGAVNKPEQPQFPEAPFVKENNLAMAKMMKGMAAEPSGNVDRDFATMMIPHHQGAIDMAAAELHFGRNEKMREIARNIVANQGEEIAVLHHQLDQLISAMPTVETSEPTQHNNLASGTHDSMMMNMAPSK
jgi:uncharacterized membrane protein YkgB